VVINRALWFYLQLSIHLRSAKHEKVLCVIIFSVPVSRVCQVNHVTPKRPRARDVSPSGMNIFSCCYISTCVAVFLGAGMCIFPFSFIKRLCSHNVSWSSVFLCKLC
jgi:hypothetical protein